jgi:hypothetical protein
MSKKYPESVVSKHATVRLPKHVLNAIEKFLGTEKAREMGFLHITDVATEAVREFLISQGYYPIPDRFEIINHDEKGVKVFDLQLRRVADVYFKPEGIWCDLCKEKSCEHIDFAVAQDDVQVIIRRKRKEGWKLPEV